MTLAPRIQRWLARLDTPERLILGLMSGTSLDGLDLALCRFSGTGAATRVKLLHHQTVPYSPEERLRLRAVVSRETVGLAAVTNLHAWLAERHAEMVLETLAAWNVEPDTVACLASHGQTIFHAPHGWRHKGASRHATLQVGDGDLLAVRTGIPTVSDFRQKEIAGGGQGAPLAPYAEALLFGHAARPRVLVNLGGIANFSWLPAAGDPHPPVSGDTGPANTLLDLAVRRFFPDLEEGFDRGGKLAAQGQVLPELLAELKQHPYFSSPCPKSTGPEDFGETYLTRALETTGLAAPGAAGPADILATLTRLTGETLGEALGREVTELEAAECFISGGGRLNPVLMAEITRALPAMAPKDTAELGIPADAKEAVLFAVLANESLWGEGFRPGQSPDAPLIGFGKISLPD